MVFCELVKPPIDKCIKSSSDSLKCIYVEGNVRVGKLSDVRDAKKQIRIILSVMIYTFFGLAGGVTSLLTPKPLLENKNN